MLARVSLALESIAGLLNKGRTRSPNDAAQHYNLNEFPKNSLLDYKYSIIISTNSQSTDDAYSLLDKLHIKDSSFCNRIFIVHNFTSNLEDFIHTKIPVTWIREGKRDIYNRFFVPENLITKYVMMFDDDVEIKSQGEFFPDRIFISTLLKELKTDKVISPFARKIEEEKYNIHFTNDSNLVLPKMMLTTVDILSTYSYFTKVANSELLEYLNDGCIDIWFNFVIAKFNANPFMRLEFEKTIISQRNSSEIDEIVHKEECVKRIKSFYPDIDLPLSKDVLYVKNL